jgi:hypothetical protein
MPATQLASARNWRNSSTAVTLAMVTGVWVSAGLTVVTAAAALRQKQ